MLIPPLFESSLQHCDPTKIGDVASQRIEHTPFPNLTLLRKIQVKSPKKGVCHMMLEVALRLPSETILATQ